MKISIISFTLHENKQFLQSITFRLTAENILESPLHQLPTLLTLLNAKSLNTQAIRFERNKWGRFDLEIQSEYPPIRESKSQNIILVDINKKINRLLTYFYKQAWTGKPQLSYEQFVSFLTRYKPTYSSWDDSELYQMPVEWEQLARAYVNLSQTKDSFYREIKRNSLAYQRPPMGDKYCRFDEETFKQDQMILSYGVFSIVFNFRPQGDSSFHLMINALPHCADLSTATSKELFELEIMLRTVHEVAARCDGGAKIVSYSQKHASMGMTIPHLHIHVLVIPDEQKFKEDLLQEFRFLATAILHPTQENPYIKLPLDRFMMQFRKSSLGPILTQELNIQIARQYQQFTFFSPLRGLSDKIEPDTIEQETNTLKTQEITNLAPI